MTTWWETDAWHAYELACGAAVPRECLLLNATWETQVVDLAPDETTLWRGVRKSYRALILKAEHDFLLGRAAPDFGARVGRVLHAQVAGRETRPSETWDMMDAWAADGHGTWHTAVHKALDADDAHCAYIFVVTHGTWAYYFSGVTTVPDLAAALLWHAMKHAKARGTRWFELGWLARPEDTAKDRSISFFKSGFGGEAVPASARWEA